jgi:hypothetical protein
MSVTLGDKRPSNSTAQKWVATFRTGHLSTEDEERSGIPTLVSLPENMDTINAIDDLRISTKRTAESMAISRERVG